MTTDLRDVSKAQAARITGHSQNTLKAIWHSIPTAYVTEGGAYYVSLAGLREWQKSRSKQERAGEGVSRDEIQRSSGLSSPAPTLHQDKELPPRRWDGRGRGLRSGRSDRMDKVTSEQRFWEHIDSSAGARTNSSTGRSHAICQDCKGSGEIVLYRECEEGPMQVATYTCDPCRGSGWLTRSDARTHGVAEQRAS